jgi:hypothetical protein
MAPRGASAKYIDEIIALIAGGMTGAEACAAKAEYPNYRSLSEWATKNGRMAELKAAWREREKSPAARMKTNVKYTEEHWDAALELLARNPRISIRKASKSLGLDLPPRGRIYGRTRSDPAFAARWREAVGSFKTVKARHEGPSKPKSPTRSGMLLRALRAHPLWIAARRVVPYSENDEDIIQEIVLAVLQGDLAQDDIKAKGNKLGFKRLQIPTFDSLDAPTKIQNRESEREMLIDTIATDNEIIFY